jgi:hypothetical protein
MQKRWECNRATEAKLKKSKRGWEKHARILPKKFRVATRPKPRSTRPRTGDFWRKKPIVKKSFKYNSKAFNATARNVYSKSNCRRSPDAEAPTSPEVLKSFSVVPVPVLVVVLVLVPVPVPVPVLVLVVLVLVLVLVLNIKPNSNWVDKNLIKSIWPDVPKY